MIDPLSALVSASLGVILSALLSPLFSERVTRFYAAIGLIQPSIQVKNIISKTIYDEGAPVDKFDGIEWKESFEVLTLKVKNTGTSPVYNVRLSLFLPGFVRVINVSKSGVHDISLGSPHNEVELSDHQEKNVVKPCSQKPYVSQIDEHGEVLFEFLIDTDTSQNGAYAYWNPTREIKGSFNWEAWGVRLPARFITEVEDNIDAYESVEEPDDLKITMDGYPFPGANPELTLGTVDDPTENPLYEKYKDQIEESSNPP